MTIVGKFTYIIYMEQFLIKVSVYANALDIHPSTVVQRAAKMGGAAWAKWEAGSGSPTLKTADKILKYMADNPVPDADPLNEVG